jgi:hypothetical protein
MGHPPPQPGPPPPPHTPAPARLWMERDPVAATQLLDVMHVVDEEHLMNECASYLMNVNKDHVGDSSGRTRALVH